MPTPFSRSLRSLDADGFRAAGLTFAIGGALLAAWLAWFVLGRVAVYEVTSAARLEVNQATRSVDALADGRIVVTRLELGRAVRAGDVLVELDADEAQLRLEEEQARLQTLSPQLNAVQSEIAAESRALDAAQRAARVALDESRSQLAEAEAPARLADDEAARLERLRADALVSEVEEVRARAEAQKRRAAVESLRLAIERLERSQQTDDQDRRVRMERLQGDLTRLRGQSATSMAAIKRLENDIERRRIRAPIAGIIGEVAELRAGAFVAEGQKLAAILPEGRLKVVAEFAPSSALGRVRPGQPARVRLLGFPWTEYGSIAATVETVAGEIRAGTVRVELAIQPDPSSAVPFQHGLPGSVEVEVERVAPVALVLRAGGRLLTRPVGAAAQSERAGG
jgi:membrane fusion protein (multidrug efflux system)